MIGPWPYPRIIAHRGGGSLAPENTLAAMRVGHEHGYRAAEFDVKFSADGVAILMHDATLERTTDGEGPANAHDYATLARLDAGRWHSPDFAGEPVAALDAVARYLRMERMLANVEIKPSPGEEAATGKRVAELCADYWKGAEVPPLLSSFSADALMAAHLAVPALPRGWLVKTPVEQDLQRMRRMGCVSLHCSHAEIDRAGIARFHDEGYRVLVYTVNEVARADLLLEWGVDGMFTDNLAVFAERFPSLL